MLNVPTTVLLTSTPATRPKAPLAFAAILVASLCSSVAASERVSVSEVSLDSLTPEYLEQEAQRQSLQPLIAPTRATALPASSSTYPGPTQIIPILEIPDDEPSGQVNFLTDLPELSEVAKQIKPDASHKLPEEVEIKSVWVFSTPSEKVENKKSLVQPNPVPQVQSTLNRLDHLHAKSLTPEVWAEAARIQNLPVESVYAVALQESGLRTGGGKFAPWPWTLNCNAPCPHGALRFADKHSAALALNKLLKAGWKNIDIGAMQINYRAHGKRFAGLDLLDARVNVIVGSVILKEALQQASGNLRNAYALYHVGSFNPDNQDRADKYATSVTRWAGHVKTRQMLVAAR